MGWCKPAVAADRSRTPVKSGSRGAPKASLRARALRLLARREHSRMELSTRLTGPDTDARELAALLDDLERRGWLSEQRLAEQQVARSRGRYGTRRVLSDLRKKGVTAPVLEAAAAMLESSQLEEARAVWRKRFGRAGADPPASADPKERARQARFLHGRGFSAEVIHRVVGGEGEEEP